MLRDRTSHTVIAHCKHAQSYLLRMMVEAAASLSLLCLALPALILGLLPAAANAQNEVIPQAPSVSDSKETYRLRVESAVYGRVEVSFDAGQHYILLGRVTRAAVAPLADKAAVRAGEVVRSGALGISIAVAAGLTITISARPRFWNGYPWSCEGARLADNHNTLIGARHLLKASASAGQHGAAADIGSWTRSISRRLFSVSERRNRCCGSAACTCKIARQPREIRCR